jgi:hypothetical protein
VSVGWKKSFKDGSWTNHLSMSCLIDEQKNLDGHEQVMFPNLNQSFIFDLKHPHVLSFNSKSICSLNKLCQSGFSRKTARKTLWAKLS